MPRHRRGFDTEAAREHLARRDRRLGAWMKRIGTIEPDPQWRKPFDPVDALARAILAEFPVIVLDEPTAGVDREQADRLLRDLLGAVPEHRAVILITHTAPPEGIVASRLRLPAGPAAA